MSKFFCCITITCLLATGSCKKKDNTPTNSFTINGNTYTATSVARELGYAILSNDASGNIFDCNFSTLPMTSGTYKVVVDSSPLSYPKANEMSVNAKANGIGYKSTGSGNVNATITIANGKITISLPDIWAKSGLTAADSIKISGDISEF